MDSSGEPGAVRSSGAPQETILPPIAADPLFVDAVEEAVSGLAVSSLPGARLLEPVGRDPHDFASLYIRHRSSFELHVRRFLRDPRDVEEVVQEGFLRLFLALPELENELQALRFCRRVLTNLCIDRYRATQRRPVVVDLDEDGAGLVDERAGIDPVVAAEDAAVVRQALALLSPLHRAVLVKREVEEKPLAQIASELDLPAESVKHVLYRARRALRRLLVAGALDGTKPGGRLAAAAGGALALALLVAGALFALPRAMVPSPKALSPGQPLVARPHLLAAGSIRHGGWSSARTSARTPAKHPVAPSATAPMPPPAGTTQPGSTPPGGSSHGRTGSGPGTGTGGKSPGSGSTPPAPAPGGRPVSGETGTVSLAQLDTFGTDPVTGPAQVTAAAPMPGSGGSVTSTSLFSAPTQLGTFSVRQSFENSAAAPTTAATFVPMLTTSSGTVTFALGASSTSVVPQPNGTIEIDASAQVVPSSTGTTSAGAPSLSAFEVRLVYSSSSLTSIVSETVVAPVTGQTTSSGPPPSGTAAATGGAGSSIVPAKEVVPKGEQ